MVPHMRGLRAELGNTLFILNLFLMRKITMMTYAYILEIFNLWMSSVESWMLNVVSSTRLGDLHPMLTEFLPLGIYWVIKTVSLHHDEDYRRKT